MNEQTQSLEAIQDIRRLMTRSSRFLSLSGLSGIAAGTWALVGSWLAANWIGDFYGRADAEISWYRGGIRYEDLVWRLLFLAAAVLGLAVASAFYFTWRRARRQGLKMWDRTARQLMINMLIPLVTGGLFILAIMRYNMFGLVAPLCLIFYGLALVNGSKYTLNDIRYLGISEIVLGLIATQYIGWGLYFWAIGFGILHIIYGFLMWWKNERKEAPEAA